MSDRKKVKRMVLVVVCVLIAGLAVTFVLPFAYAQGVAAYATEDMQGGGGIWEYDEQGNLINPETGEPEMPAAPTLKINEGYSGVLNVGGTTVMSYETNLPEGTQIFWESSDPDTASVDEYGQVTAIAPGEAWISVKASGLKDEVVVKVSQPPPSGVRIIETSGKLDTAGTNEYDIKVGAIYHFTYEFVPPNAKASSKPSWQLSNPGVATLDGKEEFIATAAGETKVIVTVDGLSAFLTFRITENENLLIAYAKRILPYLFAIVAVIIVVAIIVTVARRRETERRRRIADRKRRAQQAEIDRAKARQANAAGGGAAQANGAAGAGYGGQGQANGAAGAGYGAAQANGAQSAGYGGAGQGNGAQSAGYGGAAQANGAQPPVPAAGQGVVPPGVPSLRDTLVYGSGVGASSSHGRLSDTRRHGEEPERPFSVDDIE